MANPRPRCTTECVPPTESLSVNVDVEESGDATGFSTRSLGSKS